MIVEPPPAQSEREFAALYERHLPQVAAYIARQLNTNSADAEDLAQEAFAKAWQAWRRFESRSPASAQKWLYTIALNVVRDAARHRAIVQFTKLEPGTTVWNVARTRDPLDDPERAVCSAELREEMSAAIRSLPRIEREALEAVEVWGLSLDDAAAEQNTTRCAIKNRLFRARWRVAHLLGGSRVPTKVPPETRDAVIALRGQMPYRRIAERFGIHPETVIRIWRTVQERAT